MGVIPLPCHSSKSQWDELRDIFTRLLVANEVRGPYATGIATVNTDGKHCLFRRPIPARAFVQELAFERILTRIGEKTTVVMGHTRWPTVGDIRMNNLQPMYLGGKNSLVATHNGHIINHDFLAKRFHIPRIGQTDSEILFRFANLVYHPQDWLSRFTRILEQVEGTLACVMISCQAPHKVLLLRRGKPLELAWLPKLRALIYTSEISHLTAALEGLDWQHVPFSDREGAILNVRHLPKLERILLPVGHTCLR